ncbi:hypothetical protein VA596_01740 [Amycolatopsis sp., V23-08]|uniref:Sigma-70 family RNA polymerase sigma factor n=1 Tax=Amycolatopsis heterodermiae TaxID=3110235 RepID=A0ABU5QWF6_9PSEU|nr:hypothetical protein [Amycolatopsis sp., V23-08]MEA5358243.1 hypothetical protein [Amycolatopsis sp., V23-08]
MVPVVDSWRRCCSHRRRGSHDMATQSAFRRRHNEASPNSLDIARNTFTWLVTGPHPVSLNGRLFAGLPDRHVPLDEVRDRLLARRCPQATRDAVWAHLVLRSRTEGATWTVAAVGVALPALTSAAATLSHRFAGDPADVHAEVLRGFLTALSTIDLRPPRIMLRLRWAAYRAGYDALAEALAGPTPVAPGFRSTPPHAPWGHPDLVLARAVADGVLTRTEAALIGATRLENMPVTDWAAQHQTGEWAAYKTRKRAERRLAEYLREGATTADQLIDQVAAAVALARPVTPAQEAPRSSPSVSDTNGESERKVRRRVSKTDADSGVQGCGTNPRSARTSEVPQCA